MSINIIKLRVDRQPGSLLRRVHGNVALDARDLLARVIALEPRRVRVLHALRVHDQQRGRGVAPPSQAGRANLNFSGPHQHAHGVRIELAPLGKLRWQEPPLAARAQQVQHSAEHLVQVYRGGLLGAPAHAAQQRLDPGELGEHQDLWEVGTGRLQGKLAT